MLLFNLILGVGFVNAATADERADNKQAFDPLLLDVASPLVSSQTPHAKIYPSPLDSEHYLYPVKIIKIDGWALYEGIREEELMLPVGKHQLVLSPDFSNIKNKKAFMGALWEQKVISFNVQAGQNITIAARLLHRDDLKWAVEMFNVEVAKIATEQQTDN